MAGKPSSASKSGPICIALLRGINVGRAKRISMAELKALFEALGFRNVRTLLNSGNVVFDPGRNSPENIGRKVEQALEKRHGFSAAVMVTTAAELRRIVEANPLLKVVKDPSRHLVAFVAGRTALARAEPLLAEDWKSDAFAIGPEAAYLWCAKGILDSKLLQAFGRVMGEGVTTRNWATVLKLHAMVAEQGG